MFRLALFTEAVEQTSLEPVSHPEEPFLVEDDNVPAKHLEAKDDVIGPFLSCDRFTRSSLDLLEHTAHQSLDFHRKNSGLSSS